MSPLIILVGPTASGKSATALALAEHLGTEIISADSMQVYKYFDIGTAKPSKETRQSTVHHLIDILEPHEKFNAFEFKALALDHVRGLIRQKKIPIVAGGTGLYLKVFTQDFECAVQVSPEVRQKVKTEIKEKGTQRMHAELSKVDPQSAEKISRTDPYRIERALSVYLQTGKPISQFHASEAPAAHDFEPYFFFLDWERNRLYKNIEARIDSMMQKGWADEVKDLLKKFDKSMKPFQSIGYAQLAGHLENKSTLERAVDEIKRETRHYAKRQLTWFKKVPGIISIPVKTKDSPATLKDKILSFLPNGAALLLAALLSLAPLPDIHAGEISYYQEGLRFFKLTEYDKAVTQFIRLRQLYPEERESKRALYLLGLIYGEKKQYRTAIDYLKSALTQLPEIEDYIRFDLADAWFKSQQYPEALEEIGLLLKTFPANRFLPQAELMRAEILKQKGQAPQAIALLSRAVKKISGKGSFAVFKPFLPELILKLAQLHEEQPGEAYRLYKKLYIKYPAHPLTRQAILKMDELSREPGFSAPPVQKKERRQRLQGLFAHARFGQVVEEINALKKINGKTPLSGQLYIYLARAYKGIGRRDEAEKALDTFLKAYPQHPRAPEAMFSLARNFWNLDQNRKSIDQFRSLIQTYPKSHWALKGRFFLGRVYEANKQFSSAMEQYAILKNKHGGEEYGQRAAWRLGWLYYLTGDYAKSVQQLEKNSRRFPEGTFIETNLFWLAKALEKTGQAERSRKTYADLYSRYPYTFYGIQARMKLESNGAPAAEILGMSGRARRASQTEKTPPILLPMSGLSRDGKLHFSRTMEMIEMGLMDNAKFEIQKIGRQVRKNLSGTMWLAELYTKAESYAEAYRLLELYKNFKTRKREKELPPRFWEFFYPLAFKKSIRINAGNFNIDPLRVKSVIRQESLFDKESLSPAGARGLMQIMPETGKRLLAAGPTSRIPFAIDSLFDPELNICLGVRYLSELKQEYGNNWIHILIEYNAGPEALNQWRKRFKHITDPDVFIELIPYLETRHFVKRVLRNYAIYKILYSQPA